MVGVRRANASVTREFLSRPLRSQMWQGLLKRRFVDRLLCLMMRRLFGNRKRRPSALCDDPHDCPAGRRTTNPLKAAR